MGQYLFLSVLSLFAFIFHPLAVVVSAMSEGFPLSDLQPLPLTCTALLLSCLCGSLGGQSFLCCPPAPLIALKKNSHCEPSHISISVWLGQM
jgi:hypothetical protein